MVPVQSFFFNRLAPVQSLCLLTINHWHLYCFSNGLAKNQGTSSYAQLFVANGSAALAGKSTPGHKTHEQWELFIVLKSNRNLIASALLKKSVVIRRCYGGTDGGSHANWSLLWQQQSNCIHGDGFGNKWHLGGGNFFVVAIMIKVVVSLLRPYDSFHIGSLNLIVKNEYH